MEGAKIKITSISPGVFSQKGFDSCGCYGCACADACCRYGADVDQESHRLIMEHRCYIEKRLGAKLESCFEAKWSEEKDYLGGPSIRAAQRASGFCMFHLPDARGCVLFELAHKQGVPKRIIPSICRLYPLTWSSGKLLVYDEVYGTIEPSCNCMDPKNITLRMLFETQKDPIGDIFYIEPAAAAVTALQIPHLLRGTPQNHLDRMSRKKGIA